MALTGRTSKPSGPLIPSCPSSFGRSYDEWSIKPRDARLHNAHGGYAGRMRVSRLNDLGLVIGPALFALSPAFWKDGHYGAVGGMLIAVSTVPWVFGLIGQYDRVRSRLPLAAGLWLLLVLIGMFGTVAFGLQGFFEDVFGVDDASALAAFDGYPAAGTVMFLLAGPTFPLALLLLGMMLWHTRLSPRACSGLLVIAAIAFPIARVSLDDRASCDLDERLMTDSDRVSVRAEPAP